MNPLLLKAKEDFIRSLSFEDTERRVYFTLAEVYKELKSYNQSTEFYEKAIESSMLEMKASHKSI